MIIKGDNKKITLEDIEKELENIDTYFSSLYNPLCKALSRINFIPKSSFSKYYKQIEILYNEISDLCDRLLELKMYIIENYDIYDDKVSSVLTSVNALYRYIETSVITLEHFKMKMRAIEDSTTIEDFLFMPGEIP
ncbi:MAG: hypothetical protein LWW95_11145 [Candidatus Desulfofervidus auxilii]|nr:hypothetical protein [Candidatus Desulfofervidus auxilii]